MKIITLLISTIPPNMDAETNAQPPYNSGGGIDCNGFSFGVGYQRCICVLIRLIRAQKGNGAWEDPNKVIIVFKYGDVQSAEISWKVAALNVGKSYTIWNYDETGWHVTVTFAAVQNYDGYAIVNVLPERVPTDAPTIKATTMNPTTLAPVTTV